MALLLNSPYLVMAAITITACGVFAAIPVIWQIPPKFLTGVGAAAGIALINSFGNIGGFAGPYLTGWLRDLTRNNKSGFFVVAGLMVMAGIVVLRVGRRHEREDSAATAAAREERR